MLKHKIIRRIKDASLDFTEHGVSGNGVIYATVYQGRACFPRTTTMKRTKDWAWVVQYAGKDDWIYEHYNKFKDALARAYEICKRKIEN